MRNILNMVKEIGVVKCAAYSITAAICFFGFFWAMAAALYLMQGN